MDSVRRPTCKSSERRLADQRLPSERPSNRVVEIVPCTGREPALRTELKPFSGSTPNKARILAVVYERRTGRGDILIRSFENSGRSHGGSSNRRETAPYRARRPGQPSSPSTAIERETFAYGCRRAATNVSPNQRS